MKSSHWAVCFAAFLCFVNAAERINFEEYGRYFLDERTDQENYETGYKDSAQNIFQTDHAEEEVVEDLCTTKCGKATDGVKCTVDTEETIVCGCTNPDEVHFPGEKKCKEDLCTTKCGKATDGVKCTGDTEETIVCGCKNPNEVHFPDEKKCKVLCTKDADCANGGKCEENNSVKTCKCLEGTEGPLCKTVPGCVDKDCGTEASCGFDVETKTAVCQCNEEKLTFDVKDKKCKVNRCKDMCGVDSGAESHVLCEGDPYGKDNVTCKCKEKYMDFLPAVKSCKVNKCKEKCGKGTAVKCDGEPFGEEAVSCSCQKDDMEFLPDKKKCRAIKGLSNLAICGITVSVIIVVALIVVAVMYRRRSTRIPLYTMRFREDTVSFENTLYGTTAETSH